LRHEHACDHGGEITLETPVDVVHLVLVILDSNDVSMIQQQRDCHTATASAAVHNRLPLLRDHESLQRDHEQEGTEKEIRSNQRRRKTELTTCSPNA
jgi:hypothetical protein